MTISVGIMGAAGFAGSELVRLLSAHPDFEVRAITSDSLKGTRFSEIYPSFIGATDLAFTDHDDRALYDCEAVFLAVPHTAALVVVPRLLDAGVTVFDLSADFRLKNAAVYEKWYGVSHTAPGLLAETVFGLPELNRSEFETATSRHEIGQAVLVACAGCYPTASSLAAFPAVHFGLVKTPVIIDAISGVTGAGKKANERTHFCFANENVEAYSVGKHRHTPEIEQILGLPDQVVFTPHLAPYNRGILATVYLPLIESSSDDLVAWQARYQEFYQDDYFIEVLPVGQLPKTTAVAGTNRVHIGLALQETTNTLVVVSAIDNLCKGAAGQAVQCANIVFGLPEERGLTSYAYGV